MFTAKIFVNSHRNDILTLRIMNNRKKTKLALDVRMTQEELMDAMTENSRNPNFGSSRISGAFVKTGRIEC